MNDIEKAIEYFTRFIKLCEDAKEDFILNMSKDACTIALSALKEKQERDNMCCGKCEYRDERHYEDVGEKPCIKHACRTFGKSMQLTDYCSYFEKREV